MKKACLFALFCLSALSTGAQTANYNFTKTTAVYSDLPAGREAMDWGWTNPFLALVLPEVIDIRFFNIPTDMGDILLSSRGTVSFPPYLQAGDFVASAMGDDLIGQVGPVTGELNYILEGSSPNRILKIEWKDVGFFNETPVKSTVSFQIWLYESSDIIEFRYGPRNLVTQVALGDIGIYYLQQFSSLNSIELLDNSANPTVSSGFVNDGIHLLDIPAEGTVYRFTPWATSITPLQQDLARVWYHPGSESIKVSLTHPGTPVSVTVYDNQGRKLQEMECVNPLTTISDQSRAPGIYLLKLATATGKTYFKKLLIP